MIRLLCLALIALLPSSLFGADLSLLFMGDNGHHRPGSRFLELVEGLEGRGIALTYTDKMSDLNPAHLAQYNGLILYANIDTIEDDQAKAVLDYVASGKGFVPLHCATFCWRNSRELVDLMGGQFLRHGGEVFTTRIAEPNHPIMKGYGSFTSWDETYIHHLHNEKDRTVLEYRVAGEQAEGNHEEPWTWVRTHGKGRVFYTAWGHDERTFTHAGYHNLVERGIRWACGDDPGKVPAYHDVNQFTTPAMTSLPENVEPFDFVDVGPKIPNYTPGQKWGEQGKPRTLMQKPLSPQESIKHFVTPEGMAVRLYADESHFQAKPIAMNWDERGRLWICETVDYPNELGGDRDRIRICEDTDGDHVADRFTVFAEGLSIPTAIVIVRGGAVVQNGTETIYLKDLNGDDIADQKTTLISNWELGDTHGGVSNFRYGLDNWIWAMQGYNNSSPRIDGKPTQTFRMGFWRFKLSQTDPPQVTDLEFVRSSNNNTWGLGISEDGLIFGSTANHNPSMFVPIPNRYYERVRGWAPSVLGTIADNHLFKPITENIRQVDHHGGYTAAAGHALYTARAFPEQWWNKTAFVCGPTGHLIGTFVLNRDGANYTSTSPVNLLASNDEWSAPIMAEVGPDGSVWVIDWYNYIVQHNPTPQGFETGKGHAYESDLRDKKHGRIYRVVASEGGQDVLHPFTSLTEANNAELVKALTHPSFPWRLQAQRLLIERNAQDAIKPLLALLSDQSVDAIGLNVGAIHALQTLHELGYFNLQDAQAFVKSGVEVIALNDALKHPSAGVRRNAISILPQNEAGLEILLSNEQVFADSDFQVRLQALLSLADMPASSTAGELIARLTTTTKDPVLKDGLTSAAAVHAVPFLKSLATQKGSQPDEGLLQLVSRVAEHIGRQKPDATTLQDVLLAIQQGPRETASAILTGLTAGLPSQFEFKTTSDFDAALVEAFNNAAAESKSKLIRLASQCHTNALESRSQEIINALSKLISDSKASDQDRISAARDLIGFRAEDGQVAARIVGQINAQTSPALAEKLFQAVQLSKSPQAGDAIVEAMPTLTPTLKTVAISTLLSRPEWAEALLSGIESQEIQLADLALDQKQSLQSFPDQKLQDRARKLLSMDGGLPDANREKVVQSLLHLTKQQGDVPHGKEMFKKHCASCHKLGDLGKTIGPNLTGMAVHPKAELLVHIMDPSRSVEGNYRSYTVVTSDGLVLTGMLASETRTSVTVIDSQAKEISVPREDIEELLASRRSVMPEGFEKQMNETELCDLLEFLTDKGKYVPIPLDKYATAISTKALFHDNPDNGADRMVFPDWNMKTFRDVPFVLTDPEGKTRPNMILLHGPLGTLPPKMPQSVMIPCNTPAKAIHMLSGVGGWSYPAHPEKSVSMIVRLHYADGQTEDHNLLNGEHFADYIRRVDVPGSEFAYSLEGQQLRFVSVVPKRSEAIEKIELVKGPDPTAPIIMALTVETK